MTPHTPGPWRTGTKVFRTIYANDVLIGVMDRPKDARLAAAAPDLLAALKEIVLRYPEAMKMPAQTPGLMLQEAIKDAHEAIAKAEGCPAMREENAYK